jgi:oligopeptide ABC transporter permease protein
MRKSSELPNELCAQLGEAETFASAVKRLWRENKLAAASAIVILLFILAAILAPVLTPYTFDGMDLHNRLAPPSRAHLLGTDEAGRDVLTRMLYGSRVSLLVGIVPTVISMLAGAILGIIAGYNDGRTDAVIMRIADVMLAFPSMFLAMAIMYTLGDGMINIFLALALVNWASVARIVRAETLKLKETEFVEAARSIGVGKLVIMLRHIFPNCAPSLIVLFTLNIPSAILSESSLSFLSIGIKPPQASWGLMVNAGRQFLYSQPWLSLSPSVAIMVVVLAFNFLGDGLRDVLDPHLKNQ